MGQERRREHFVIWLPGETYDRTVKWIRQAVSQALETVEIGVGVGGLAVSIGGEPYRIENDAVMVCYGRRESGGGVKGRCQMWESGGGRREYKLKEDGVAGIDFLGRFVLAAQGGKILLLYDSKEGNRSVLVREVVTGDGGGRRETCLQLTEIRSKERRDDLIERHLEEAGRASLIGLAVKLRMPCEFYEVLLPFVACHREGPGASSGLTYRFLSIEGAIGGAESDLNISRLRNRLKECLEAGGSGFRP